MTQVAGVAIAVAAAPASPYKGLVPYAEADSAFFFGRSRDRKIIGANLRTARLTLLYGPSGVGKSSVLQAGVVAELHARARDDLEAGERPGHVAVAFSQWAGDPAAALAARIREAVAEALGEELPAGAGLSETLEAWAALEAGTLLVILDQFEEYFLYHRDDDGVGTFAVEFPRAVNRLELPVHFLISIREDAIARLDRFKGRIPTLFANRLQLERLDREAGREAILAPLGRFNALAPDEPPVQAEPELVERVLDQVTAGRVRFEQTGAGAEEDPEGDARIEAPYLQLVMSRIWQAEQAAGSRMLRLQTLVDDLKGAKAIVQDYLDQAMNGLTPQEQAVLAAAFRYLVTSSGTKIAWTVSDLANVAAVPEGELGPALEKLAAARIVRPVDPPPDRPDQPRFEIFHDVLAETVLDWRLRWDREVERRRHARKRRKLVGVAVAMAAGFAAMAVLAIYSIQQKNEANAQRETAVAAAAEAQAQRAIARSVGSRAAAAASEAQVSEDPELALLLAEWALDQGRSAEAEAAFREALPAVSGRSGVLPGHTGPVADIITSPDGRYVLTTDEETARLWRVQPDGGVSATDPIVLAGEHESLYVPRFSRDGAYVVIDGNTEAYVWRTDTGELVATLSTGGPTLYTADISPDGRYVVGATDGKAVVWETASGATMVRLHPQGSAVNMARFSDDGSLIVTAAEDGTARVWDAVSGEEQGAPLDFDGPVRGALFSPDGSRIVTWGYGGVGKLWNASTRDAVRELKGSIDAGATSVEFSPDGELLAGIDGKRARVWSTRDGKLVSTLAGHTDTVNTVVFSGDGELVVTASEDGTARVWNARTGATVGDVLAHSDQVLGAAFLPGDKSIVTGGNDETARIWAVGTGVVLRGHGDYVASVSFSPDGTQVATTGLNAIALVQDTSSGRRFPLRDPELNATAAEFSPDGTLIATGSTGGSTLIWRTDTREVVERLEGHEGFVQDVAFSADGTRLVTAGDDSVARVWSVATGDPETVLEGESAMISAAFSPDGTQVLTVSDDATATIWDVAGARALHTLRGERDSIYSAAFSPDGQFVVTGGDAVVRIWSVETGREVDEPLEAAAIVNSVAFDPDGRYLVAGSSDGTVLVWDFPERTELDVFTPHSVAVRAIDMGPDARIVTASDDGTAKVFECLVCAPLEELRRRGRELVGRELTPAEIAKYLPWLGG